MTQRPWFDSARYDDDNDWAAQQREDDAAILDADMDLMSTFDDRADYEATGDGMSVVEADWHRGRPE